MGLDVSHGAWHGAYSAFSRWREQLAQVAGIPLGLMEGYYPDQSARLAVRDATAEASAEAHPCLRAYVTDVNRWLPITWEVLRPDPLIALLDHSDCDGDLSPGDCRRLADRLEALLPLLPEGDAGGHIGYWREKTQTFIDGCRLAAERGERLRFG